VRAGAIIAPPAWKFERPRGQTDVLVKLLLDACATARHQDQPGEPI
jgi:hypothetical protein